MSKKTKYEIRIEDGWISVEAHDHDYDKEAHTICLMDANDKIFAVYNHVEAFQIVD